MSLSPWLTVLLAIPVLLAGQRLVQRIGILSRFNIPAPVAGGLLVLLSADRYGRSCCLRACGAIGERFRVSGLGAV